MLSRLCLILEDEPLIAMDVADAFESAGYALLGPFATCSTALSALETQTPSIAIVDLLVKDGSCAPVFAKLRSLGVPTIIYTGRPAASRADFSEATWVSKPCAPESLIEAAEQLLLVNKI